MAAPAEMDEFKGTVANVFTQKYWPAEIDAVLAKVEKVSSEFAKQEKEIKERQKNGGEWKDDQAKLEKAKRAKIESSLTKDELFLLENGKSNAGYHYYGSAKFFGQAGKAFAETMVNLMKK
jgi:hypothetical protein